MARRSRKKYDNEQSRTVHLARLVPNMVTILGICLGLSAIRFALREQWEPAVSFIIFASLVDAIDGRLARLLNATSGFGAQLDSLADFINFGVAPSIILYLWITHNAPGFGWAVVLFFVICAAIRLARFNSDLDAEEKPPVWAVNFFVGMPAPAGALACLAPMASGFGLEFDYPEIWAYLYWLHNPYFVCLWATLIGALMASRIPTFSFKKLAIKKRYASLVLMLVGLLTIAAVTEPWLTGIGIGIWYMMMFPLGIIRYYQYKNGQL